MAENKYDEYVISGPLPGSPPSSGTMIAWVNNGGWPAYGKERMTMIFGAEARVESAPFEAERRTWDSYDMVANTPI